MRTPVVGLAVAFMALLAACGTEDEVAPPTTDSRTPSSTDSPTSSPTELQYWVTPTATPPPTDWAALIEGVADHLTANADSADCLAGLFAAWNMPSDGTPSCVASDLDADGEDEYVVRLARPSGPTDGIGLRDWLIGQILVFDRVGQRYEPVFDLADIWASRVSKDPAVAGQEAQRLVHPIIYALKDLTGDGIPELVLTTNDCGAHTCFLMLYVYTNRDGAYVSLLTSPEGPTSGISVPVADNQLRLDDLDGDGVFELILPQGTVTLACAGPHRVTLHTYLCTGVKFVLTISH